MLDRGWPVTIPRETDDLRLDSILGDGPSDQLDRAVREGLLRAGAQWWVCRSANAAMWALAQSGVPFRTIVHEDGTIEHWQQPELPVLPVPSPNPGKRG